MSAYLIISGDRTPTNGHLVFWGPNRAGYTAEIDRAGRYTREELQQCNLDADDVVISVNNLLRFLVHWVEVTATGDASSVTLAEIAGFARQHKEVRHGCCTDRACDAQTCMQLPAGKTCDVCVWFYRCSIFGFTTAGSDSCDFFPRRFRETPVPKEGGAK